MGDLAISSTLLQILEFCEISTVKSLRLTKKAVRDIIDAYQISISVTLQQRWFTKEQISSFKLLHKSTELQVLFSLDYRVRATRWLTDVALENLQEDLASGGFGNIGANESRGDSVRSYVAAGWAVLWHLSDIARIKILDATGMDKTSSKKRVSSLTRGSPIAKELDISIKKELPKYINILSFEQRYGFRMMHGYLGAVFRDRVFDDPRVKRSDWRTGNEFGVGNSWLNWLVLREGPKFFLECWATKEGNKACSKLIVTEWSRRSKEQVLDEYTFGKEIMESLFCAASPGDNSMKYRELMGFAVHGREIERVHVDVCYHLGRRLPHHVIRSVEREYSDYSS